MGVRGGTAARIAGGLTPRQPTTIDLDRPPGGLASVRRMPGVPLSEGTLAGSWPRWPGPGPVPGGPVPAAHPGAPAVRRARRRSLGGHLDAARRGALASPCSARARSALAAAREASRDFATPFASLISAHSAIWSRTAASTTDRRGNGPSQSPRSRRGPPTTARSPPAQRQSLSLTTPNETGRTNGSFWNALRVLTRARTRRYAFIGRPAFAPAPTLVFGLRDRSAAAWPLSVIVAIYGRRGPGW